MWYCSQYVDTAGYGPGLAATIQGLGCAIFANEGMQAPAMCSATTN
jgi:hypothetical protein